MASAEAATLYIAIAAYTLTFGLGVFAFFIGSARAEGVAVFSAAGGLIAETATIALRWAAIGHPPVFGTFENSLAASWFLVLFGLLSYWRWSRFVNLVPALAFSSVFILWFGLKFDQTKIPLTISERSLWVDFHAVVAWLAYSTLTIAFFMALLIITGRGRLYRGLSKLGRSIPVGKVAEDLMARYVNFVFVMQTATITSGSYYALLTFGRWWRWDPVESLSLSSWFVLALFIHLKRSFGWRGKSLAWLIIIAFILAILSYWFLVFLPAGSTFHIFDIGRREHI